MGTSEYDLEVGMKAQSALESYVIVLRNSVVIDQVDGGQIMIRPTRAGRQFYRVNARSQGDNYMWKSSNADTQDAKSTGHPEDNDERGREAIQDGIGLSAEGHGSAGDSEKERQS